MIRLQAMPFAPGVAKGILQTGEADGEHRISLVTQGDLDGLSGHPAGLIVVDGAPLSHPMIRTLGLGVPTVIVSQAQARELPEDRELWLDGSTGLISDAESAPSEPTESSMAELGQPLRTSDGTEILLSASVASIKEAALAKEVGAGSIGLVRSEGLILEEATAPDAAWFRAQLARLMQAAAPLSVTVRLIDFASDKRPPWLPGISGASGPIGLQGSRLYGEPGVRRVLDAELAALAGLAESGQFEVLVPYLVFPEDFLAIKDLVRSMLGSQIRIGAMIETPGAAFDIAHWLEIADFVSIGCNDLMQCLFAADRDIPELNGWLDPHAPGLFRFLRYMLREAGLRGGAVRLCGLLPQMPSVLPVLAGLGFRRLTAASHLIPYLARAVRRTDLEQARQLAEDICAARTAGEVRARLGLPSMPAWEQRGLAAC